MTIGKIGEFCAASGNWSLYVERLEMYFKVNTIAEDLWLPTLIAVMGEETYDLLSNLVSPKKPAEMSYEQVTEVLRKHLQPKRSFMAERYRFRQRRQNKDESITQYIAELKKLAKHCDFASGLEENLRDQLVCGLKSDVIRQRLFAEDGLKYERAVRLACALEGAERDAAAVDQAGPSEARGRAEGTGEVHSLVARAAHAQQGRRRGASAATARRPSGAALCNVCGASEHASNECRFKNFVCRLCGNKGHLKRACPERAGATGRGRGRSGVYSLQTTVNGKATDGGQSEDSELEGDLHQLCLNSYKPVEV
ncbi:uncharacterized protein LOC133516658 [Cydia pomonella]|uniref:uncharacterized protein LOC133516658 n=1 Tax=Cydia pomonella TaxID=82600 RepID=UPI002ADE80A6|nr:uncharacterized protein LOC133516658 [Cydia pomonella]